MNATRFVVTTVSADAGRVEVIGKFATQADARAFIAMAASKPEYKNNLFRIEDREK